jgi:phosphoserine phosphatase
MYGINLIRANRVDISMDGKLTGEIEIQGDEKRKDVVTKEIMDTLNISPAVTAMIGDSGSGAAIAKLVLLAIAHE